MDRALPTNSANMISPKAQGVTLEQLLLLGSLLHPISGFKEFQLIDGVDNFSIFPAGTAHSVQREEKALPALR